MRRAISKRLTDIHHPTIDLQLNRRYDHRARQKSGAEFIVEYQGYHEMRNATGQAYGAFVEVFSSHT
jgi:hypothetical protein